LEFIPTLVSSLVNQLIAEPSREPGMKEVEETEMTSKELSKLLFLLITKNLMVSTTEFLKMVLKSDGTNTDLVPHTHLTQLTLNALFLDAQENTLLELSSDALTVLLLLLSTFAKMNLIKFMVLSMLLMVILKVGVLILPLVSMVGDTTAMDTAELTFYEVFLQMKLEVIIGEVDLPLKILKPPLKKF